VGLDEGVQITPVGVSSGGELGPGGEPHGAASQHIGVLAVVPMVANGTDGAVIHLGARRWPPARGAWPCTILMLGVGLQCGVHGLAGTFFKSPQLKTRNPRTLIELMARQS
jgi:hypothetical protein